MPDVRATDPITLGTPPAGSQLAELWKATDGRFPESRKRIRRARDVTNRDRTTLGTDPGFLTLPQRLMAVTMTNSMASQYGTPELTRYGRPTATDKSDELETIIRDHARPDRRGGPVRQGHPGRRVGRGGHASRDRLGLGPRPTPRRGTASTPPTAAPTTRATRAATGRARGRRTTATARTGSPRTRTWSST
jgi:hypothetical protein